MAVLGGPASGSNLGLWMRLRLALGVMREKWGWDLGLTAFASPPTGRSDSDFGFNVSSSLLLLMNSALTTLVFFGLASIESPFLFLLWTRAAVSLGVTSDCGWALDPASGFLRPDFVLLLDFVSAAGTGSVDFARRVGFVGAGSDDEAVGTGNGGVGTVTGSNESVEDGGKGGEGPA